MSANSVYHMGRLTFAHPGGKSARKHPSVVPARGQDRGDRAERRREVDPAADHGRPGDRLHRQCPGPAKGIRIGCLVQEPALDNRRTVRESVMDGVAEEISLLGAFNSAAARLAEEDPDEILAELAGLLSTLPPSGGEDRMEGDRRTDDPSAVPRWGR